VDVATEISRLEAHLNEHWSEALDENPFADELFRDAVILAETAIYDEHIEASNDSSYVAESVIPPLPTPVHKPGKNGTYAELQKYCSYRADVIEHELKYGVTGSTVGKVDPVAEATPSKAIPPWYGDEMQYHLDQREAPCDIVYDMSDQHEACDIYHYMKFFEGVEVYKDADFYIKQVQSQLKPDAVCQTLGYTHFLIEKTKHCVGAREHYNNVMQEFDNTYSGDNGREVPFLFQ